ncbi:hypothetical protein Taro_027667 [Colocasia esculenta]|uniref:Uncharacterized protein n=1 Tax=Colocasia esculenta TaxID=4460 RepID=A0A843VPG1_COLES|nr:hypothetical protein [Colocasia esculenta]
MPRLRGGFPSSGPNKPKTGPLRPGAAPSEVTTPPTTLHIVAREMRELAEVLSVHQNPSGTLAHHLGNPQLQGPVWVDARALRHSTLEGRQAAAELRRWDVPSAWDLEPLSLSLPVNKGILTSLPEEDPEP